MEMVTREEKATLEKRLAHLLANRSAISNRIAEARALGDLKENAEYHAAREDQGMQEAEIERLTKRLANVSIIDETAHKGSGVVFLGATVKMREDGSDEVELFRLVGEASAEMPPEYVEVTVNSPMGEALLKARVGEIIAVRGPRGLKRFEVLEIV
jgi:transcription elongation factor GreA